MKRPITIFIAEDHILVREAWQLVLNEDPRFTVIGSCSAGEEAVQLASQLAPDVILMDINLQGMDGFRATEEIHRQNPSIKIIGLSMHVELNFVKKMMSAGASGYVTKNSGADELFAAIGHEGPGKFVCEEVRQELSMHFAETNSGQPSTKLSPREQEIVTYIKRGHSSREIASMLGLSRKTVDHHRYNIMKKLNVHNTAALVNYVNKQGMS